MTSFSGNSRLYGQIVFLYATLLITAAWCGSGNAATPSYSKAQFLIELKSDDIDHIVSVMNAVKRQRYKGELLPLVLDAWEGRSDRLPDVNWSMLSSDRVRVELADVLLQAYRNGLIVLNESDFEKPLQEWIDSRDHDVAKHAVITLSLINNETNVLTLRNVAENKPKMFRAAVFSLSRMCEPTAILALAEIEEKIRDRDKLEFLQKTRDSLGGYRCPK